MCACGVYVRGYVEVYVRVGFRMHAVTGTYVGREMWAFGQEFVLVCSLEPWNAGTWVGRANASIRVFKSTCTYMLVCVYACMLESGNVSFDLLFGRWNVCICLYTYLGNPRE